MLLNVLFQFVLDARPLVPSVFRQALIVLTVAVVDRLHYGPTVMLSGHLVRRNQQPLNFAGHVVKITPLQWLEGSLGGLGPRSNVRDLASGHEVLALPHSARQATGITSLTR